MKSAIMKAYEQCKTKEALQRSSLIHLGGRNHEIFY